MGIGELANFREGVCEREARIGVEILSLGMGRERGMRFRGSMVSSVVDGGEIEGLVMWMRWDCGTSIVFRLAIF